MSNVSVISQTMTPDQVELLKRTVAKDCTDDELKLFMHVCKRTGLDAFARQIYAVKRGGRMVIQTSIDGFRLTADRSTVYAGSDDPLFDDEKNPTRATVTVYKIVQGIRCPFTATARWSEYFPGEAQGHMWKKMPCVMLGKCAESLALRKAFPAELSGVYSKEEMAQADQAPTIDPKQDPRHPDFDPTEYEFKFGAYEHKSCRWLFDQGLLLDWINETRAINMKRPMVGVLKETFDVAIAAYALLSSGEVLEIPEPAPPKPMREVGPECCHRPMMMSKYDKTPTWYCVNCKKKLPAEGHSA